MNQLLPAQPQTNSLLLSSPRFVVSQVTAQSRDFSRYVDPFIGTAGHGHTFPGATMPFGMVQLSPDTRLTGWDGCSGYHYSDHIIYGFSHTHLSGTGISDYGDILLMPTVGEPYLNALDGSPASKPRRATPRASVTRMKLRGRAITESSWTTTTSRLS